jgi:hypothetical protein
MARGWGRSEEDQGSDKEHAREAASERPSGPTAAQAAARRRTLELSLAHVEEQLALTTHAPRRQALEMARAELRAQLAALGAAAAEPPRDDG